MKLDQILGTISLPLEHDGLEFRLVPFSNARTRHWNKVVLDEPTGDDVTLESIEKTHEAQLNVLAGHLRDCLVDGKAQRVTAKWISEQFPQTVITDLVTFFRTGTLPTWAQDGDSGN